MGCMAIHLGMRWVLGDVMRRHARRGRGLLVGGHDGVMRQKRLQCDECANEAEA